MACERYREALSDVAAGAAAPAPVEAHLASCAACRAELEALHHALDTANDELARVLLAEPSPDLVARIRTAVAESAGAKPGWRLAWGFAVPAAAAVVVVAILVAQRGPGPQPPVTAVERAPAHETPRAAPATQAAGPGTGRRSQPVESRPGATSPTRGVSTPEPEVLVPADEAEALARLAASLRRRSVPPLSLLVADLTAPLAEPEPGEIRPLEIVPLDPAERDGAE